MYKIKHSDPTTTGSHRVPFKLRKLFTVCHITKFGVSMTWRPSPFTSHHGSWQANKLTDCLIIFCTDCKKIIASTIHAVIQYKKFTDWEFRILFPKDAPFHMPFPKEFIQNKHAFLPSDCYVLFKLNQIKCHCCILNKCTIRQHICAQPCLASLVRDLSSRWSSFKNVRPKFSTWGSALTFNASQKSYKFGDPPI